MIETSRDWNIRKKLDETRRVYVMPARAKEIKVIRAEDIRKAVEALKRDPTPDPTYEIWTNRDSELHRYLDELYEEMMQESFKTIIRCDSWADTDYDLHKMHWLMNRYGTYSSQYLPNVYVIDNSKLD